MGVGEAWEGRGGGTGKKSIVGLVRLYDRLRTLRQVLVFTCVYECVFCFVVCLYVFVLFLFCNNAFFFFFFFFFLSSFLSFCLAFVSSFSVLLLRSVPEYFA